MEAEMYLHAAEPLRADTVTCIPRLRGGGGVRRRPRQHGGAPPAPASSVSVIDRVRDVLLRLAMLSAASSPPKAGARLQHQHSTVAGAPTRAASVRMSPSYSDSYPSDAVDDCIEFLKRSAAGAGTAAATPAAPELAVSSAPS
ncbi:unnamed protein product [Alopecurus aequalis]